MSLAIRQTVQICPFLNYFSAPRGLQLECGESHGSREVGASHLGLQEGGTSKPGIAGTALKVGLLGVHSASMLVAPIIRKILKVVSIVAVEI